MGLRPEAKDCSVEVYGSVMCRHCQDIKDFSLLDVSKHQNISAIGLHKFVSVVGEVSSRGGKKR